MPIEDIVHINIRRESQTIDRASFGTIAIAAYHTHWGVTERSRTYASSTALTTLVAEGFVSSDPVYQFAQKLTSQNPRPRTFKVLKLSTTWTQRVRLTPVVASSTVYSGTCNGQAWTFTSGAGAVLADVCTGIATAIGALTGVGADGSSGTAVDITADAAAKLFDTLKGTSAGAYTLEDVTAATGLADELAALRGVDDSWYGLVLDCPSSARIAAAAAYVETIPALLICNTADSECVNPAATTDIMSVLKAASYARTAALYHPEATSFAGAAWLACVLPYDAGGATWAFKTLRGVNVTKLSSNEQGAVATKKGNFYVSVAGVAGARWGVTASGEYVDTTLCIDWLHARWGERLFALLASAPKLGYSDASVVKIKSELGAVNGIAVRQGILSGDPAPTVSAPKVADVDPQDRAARQLPDVTITAKLEGAIHEIFITASLSV